MVEREKRSFAKQIGAIMDAAEPEDETTQDEFSKNASAPCISRRAGRDYFEMHIHLGGRSEGNRDSRGKDRESSSEEELADLGDLGTDTVEVLVPRALRIARQIRSTDRSM